MLLTDIHVRAFIGPTLKTYLHSIAKLRSDVFRDYPYLAETDLLRELNHLKKFASSKEAIGVLVFDGTTLVGVSLGLPLSLLDEFKKPFLAAHLDVNSYYFFSDSALLKNYRGRGIGHHFFDVREAHVQHLKKYKQICFFSPEKPEVDPQRPSDYILLNDFWRKRGYVHYPQLQCTLAWKEIGHEEPTKKTLTCWVKDLHYTGLGHKLGI